MLHYLRILCKHEAGQVSGKEEKIMKNYEGQRLNLDIALAMGFVLMGLVGFAVGRHPEDTALLAFFGFCAIAVTIGALRIV
mgnify:FL=1